jgi:hypothetical protein
MPMRFSRDADLFGRPGLPVLGPEPADSFDTRLKATVPPGVSRVRRGATGCRMEASGLRTIQATLFLTFELI